MRLFVFFISIFIHSYSAWSQVNYVDVASQVGIDHQYLQGAPGGGVNFVDFDGDGWDDMTLATAAGDSIFFYKNINGTFQKIPSLVAHTEESKHVLWVDYDNDEDLDLYVTTYEGTNRLYKNKGNLVMEDVTIDAGLLQDSLRHFGAAWGDYNRDGWLDLYYSERKTLTSGTTNKNRLFKNNADGTFTETTFTANAADENKLPFCSAFFDYDNDKWPDIYISNDKFPPNTLLRNNSDGTFMDVSTPTQSGIVISAMCVTVGDYDNDADQDLYITNIADGNVLLQNDEVSGINYFTDVSSTANVGFYGTAWGSNFLDADNDQKLDLYVSGAVVGTTTPSSTFYKNEGNGVFSQNFTGFQGDTVQSYCNAVGDFNQDGFPDIMVSNFAPYPSQLWQNAGGNHNFLKIKLKGVLSNRQGVGSKIEVFTGSEYQMRYTHCGIGYMGQNSTTEIIGLGNHTIADSIKITWTTGHVDVLLQVDENQVLEVVEGSTTSGNIDVDSDVVIVSPPTNEFHFVEGQDSAMINHYFSHDIFMGGGAAFFDYDNDGDDDVYITSGLNMDHFYENNGDGTFEDKSLWVGLLGTQYYYTHGVVVGDVDNDGFKDVFVTTKQSNIETYGKNFLFRNNGNGTFTDIWNQIQDKDKAQSVSAVFTDYNLDGLLDIYVINYVESTGFTTDANGIINGYAHECFVNTFYKNLGNGQFEEVAEVLHIDDDGCSLAVVSTDYDNDGDMDIYIANDFGEFIEPNKMYKNINVDSMQFYNEIAPVIDADIAMYGMGIAVGDVDQDLDLDYYITNFGKNVFLRNDGDNFTNITDATGAGDEWINNSDSLFSISWGTAFLDVDNDSDLDLYVANGFVPSPAFLPSNIHMNDKLYLNEGNMQFTDTDTTYGIQNKFTSRGMAYSDYDNDGDLDIMTVVLNVPINGTGWKTILYRNEKGNEKNWLQVSLEGVDVNRDAYGSKIYVHAGGKVLLQELSGGSSHCSHNSTKMHFGLDTIASVDSVTVAWTGGERFQTLYDIDANQHIQILEDTTIALMSDTTTQDTVITISTFDLDNPSPQLSVFPNPTNDILNVMFGNNKDVGVLLLHDILGREVRRFFIEKNKKQIQINVNDMERGIYFLIFKIENQQVFKKIVVD